GTSAGMGASPAAGSPTTGADAATGNSNATLSSGALFDGGGMTASAPGACGASATASPPLASLMGPGSSVGPGGIPPGSTGRGGPRPSIRCADPQSVGARWELAAPARRHDPAVDAVGIDGAKHNPVRDHSDRCPYDRR